MAWELEMMKIAGSVVTGFFAGRFQTTYNDRIARNKDVQSELLKAIRSCSTSAIDYHARTISDDQVRVKAFHLKNQLWRIRTDLLLTEKACSIAKGSLLSAYLPYFDAITEYPFEAAELDADFEQSRLARISTSGETLAEQVSQSRPRIF
jgi:hypothetical protein